MKRVTFEVAKTLHSIGFDIPTNEWYFHRDGKLYRGEISKSYAVHDWNHREGVIGVRISAPALPTVCDWLREKKGLHVFVDVLKSGWTYMIVDIATIKGYGVDFNPFHPDHDTALISGIKKALTLIEKI